MKTLLVAMVSLIGVMAQAEAATPIPDGRWRFQFVDTRGQPDRPLDVYTYRPRRCDSKCPIVFVMAGVKRNAQDGPGYRNLSLRVMKGFAIGGNQLQVIAEGFNLTNHHNYDVQSVVGGHYLSGPTLANPALPYVNNPRFGLYNATLPAREYQLGLRWVY